MEITQKSPKQPQSATGSVEDLRRALSAAYEVDENIKTGLFEGDLALEYFIAKL